MGLGTAMAASGLLVVGGMVAASKAAADFQSQLVLLQTHAGATQQDMQTLGGYILRVAGQLGFDPTSLAEAVYHVQSSLTSLPAAMQNVTTDENVLYASAQLAAIGHANLEDSVNAVTKAFVVYQKDGYTAADITAIFNKTVGEGNMRLQELNAAFAGGLLPVAEQAGIKLQSVGAALATMTDEGIPAARAATYLRSAIIQMTIPSNAAVGALEAIGVSANDTQSQISSFNQVLVQAGINQTDVAKELQKTGSLGDTLTWLRDKIEKTGMSSQDAAAILDKSFGGIRSGTGVVTLYNNLDGLVKKEQDATSATAEWSHTWSTFTGQDPNFMLNQLKASWDSLVIILGTSFLPVMLKIVQEMIPLIQNLGLWIAQNQDLVAAAAQGAAVFLIVGGAIVFVAGLIGRLIGFIIPIIRWFWNLGEALATVGSVFEGTSDVAVTFGEVIGSAFGGPVTLAIGIILALISVGVMLVTHWNQVKAFAATVWRDIGGYVMQAVSFVRGIVQSELGFILTIWTQHHTQIIAIMQAAWTVIKVILLGALVAVGIAIALVAAIIAAAIIIILAVGMAFMWVAGKIMDLVPVVLGFVSGAWKALSNFFSNLIGVVVDAWTQFAAHPAYWIGWLLGFIIGMNIKISKAITDFFVWLIPAAAEAFNRFVNAGATGFWNLLNAAWAILPQLPGIFNNVMNWVANAVWNGMGAILNAFNSIANNLITGAWNAGQDLVRGLWNGIQSLAGWLRNQVASWVSGIVAGMMSAAGISSPSKLVAESVGVPFAQGLASGFQGELPRTQAVLNSGVLGLATSSGQSLGATSASFNISQNQKQDIILKIDNDVLARTIIQSVTNWRDKSELI